MAKEASIIMQAGRVIEWLGNKLYRIGLQYIAIKKAVEGRYGKLEQGKRPGGRAK